MRSFVLLTALVLGQPVLATECEHLVAGDARDYWTSQKTYGCGGGCVGDIGLVNLFLAPDGSADANVLYCVSSTDEAIDPLCEEGLKVYERDVSGTWSCAGSQIFIVIDGVESAGELAFEPVDSDASDSHATLQAGRDIEQESRRTPHRRVLRFGEVEQEFLSERTYRQASL